MIFKNLCAGNVGFFNLRELTALENAFINYTRAVQEFEKTMVNNERRRAYEAVMSGPNPELMLPIIFASLSRGEIDAVQRIQIVEQSPDTLLEKKRLMCRNIALILAAKAKEIVQKHSAFKRTFRYTPADDELLEQYFIHREIDYLELRPKVHAMYTHLRSLYERKWKERVEEERALQAQAEQEDRERDERVYYGFCVDAGDHSESMRYPEYREDWDNRHGDRFRC